MKQGRHMRTSVRPINKLDFLELFAAYCMAVYGEFEVVDVGLGCEPVPGRCNGSRVKIVDNDRFHIPQRIP